MCFTESRNIFLTALTKLVIYSSANFIFQKIESQYFNNCNVTVQQIQQTADSVIKLDIKYDISTTRKAIYIKQAPIFLIHMLSCNNLYVHIIIIYVL